MRLRGRARQRMRRDEAHKPSDVAREQLTADPPAFWTHRKDWSLAFRIGAEANRRAGSGGPTTFDEIVTALLGERLDEVEQTQRVVAPVNCDGAIARGCDMSLCQWDAVVRKTIMHCFGCDSLIEECHRLATDARPFDVLCGVLRDRLDHMERQDRLAHGKCDLGRTG